MVLLRTVHWCPTAPKGKIPMFFHSTATIERTVHARALLTVTAGTPLLNPGSPGVNWRCPRQPSQVTKASFLSNPDSHHLARGTQFQHTFLSPQGLCNRCSLHLKWQGSSTWLLLCQEPSTQNGLHLTKCRLSTLGLRALTTGLKLAYSLVRNLPKMNERWDATNQYLHSTNHSVLRKVSTRQISVK